MKPESETPETNFCGMDFGTSNCSVGIWKDGAPLLVEMEPGTTSLASVFYTSKADVSEVQVDAEELERRVQASLRAQERRNQAISAQNEKLKGDTPRVQPTEYSHAYYQSIELGRLRRERSARDNADMRAQSIEAALASGKETLFGSAALAAHLEDPTQGYFIKSPKSFLAAELTDKNLLRFTEIVSRMLNHLRSKVAPEGSAQYQKVVLGRPVKFHGTTGKEGEAQALTILRTSASAAGFIDIEFLEEPIAAALAYEQTTQKDHCVLVFDAGGGTTDCSMVRVGPSYRSLRDRSASILATVGDRIGGNDLDIRLAGKLLLPHLGKGDLLKDGREIPTSRMFDAIEVTDVNAQARFLSVDTGRWIRETLKRVALPRRFTRFQRLYEEKNNNRLVRSAEQAKIKLSSSDKSKLDLRYLEPELFASVTREQFDEAVERDLSKMIALLEETRRLAGIAPDAIFITGGTAKSPVIRERIRRSFGDVPLIAGDDFGSVAVGLTLWAQRIYGSDNSRT